MVIAQPGPAGPASARQLVRPAVPVFTTEAVQAFQEFDPHTVAAGGSTKRPRPAKPHASTVAKARRIQRAHEEGSWLTGMSASARMDAERKAADLRKQIGLNVSIASANSKSSATAPTYSSHFHWFLDYRRALNILPPLPASRGDAEGAERRALIFQENLDLASFVVWFSMAPKKKGSGKRSEGVFDSAVSAIRDTLSQSPHDFCDPVYGLLPDGPLKRVLKFLNRHLTRKGRPHRLPLLREHLEIIHKHGQNTRRGRVVTAAIAMAKSGLLRVGEFAVPQRRTKFSATLHLTRAHIRFVDWGQAPVDGKSFAVVSVRRLKKDGSSAGARHPTFFPFVRGDPLNTAALLKAMCDDAPLAPEDGTGDRVPLLDMGGGRQPGGGREQVPLCAADITAALRTMTADPASKVDPADAGRFTTHSMRIGGATSLCAAGVHPMTVQWLGRWDTEVYRIYCQRNMKSMLQASAAGERVTNVQLVHDAYFDPEYGEEAAETDW